MIKNSLLLSMMLIAFLASAQHPLVGTWQMVSIGGTNVDGQKFKLDSTTIRETKIITPTHYILLASHKEEGQWKFNRCYFGRVKIDEKKYFEYPVASSERIYDNLTTDFDWQINGKNFVQSGSITRPDGKVISLDQFVFTRSEVSPVSDTKFVGTWSAEQSGVQSFIVITPTHWMLIEKHNNEFSKASGGVYRVNGNRADLSILYGTENEKSTSAILKGQQISFNNLNYSKLNQ